jgi:hypothetical protein
MLCALDRTLLDYLRFKHDTDDPLSQTLSRLYRSHDFPSSFVSILDLAMQCGLHLDPTGEVRENQTIPARVPSVHIERARGFRIGIVTAEMLANRPHFRAVNPAYNSTFEMLTIAEAEKLKQSRSPGAALPFPNISEPKVPANKSRRRRIWELLSL